MRRLIIENPVSRAARLSRYIALFALATAAIGLVLARAERIEPTATLAVIGTALVLGLAAVATSVTAFVRIWQEGFRGLGRAIQGLFLALLLLAYPAYLSARAATLPVLNDIATDPAEPPSFSRSRLALAARGGHVPPELGEAERERMRAAYSGLEPILIERPPEEAFALVRRAAQSLGWRVIEAIPPGGRRGTGRLDAIERSLLLGLPDDITVRIRPTLDGARIDLRSASRVGRHDLGVNARRIERFATAIEALDEAPDAKP